ncbi:MAG: FtsQ-type POTRA domain-containing protein [Candidatus Kapabacteria bacterium]|nr:FtsQ-type POTRA domain-containing protein [Candidatus Kapabacteria bacterium]
MKARRKQIAKKKPRSRDDSRRFASAVSVGLLIAGAVAGLVAVANKWMKREPLEQIRIVGRHVLDSAEVVQKAAIPDSLPLGKLNLKEIETRLIGHPFITDASVYREEQGTLVLQIQECAPVAVAFVGGAPVYLDSAGITLPFRFSSAAFDVPVLGGISNGRKVDSLQGVEAVGVVKAIREFDPALYQQISEIRREPTGQYTLLFADGGIPIRAGGAAEIPRHLKKLDLFWRTVLLTEGAASIQSIDLRWQGQVVVKKRTGENA